MVRRPYATMQTTTTIQTALATTTEPGEPEDPEPLLFISFAEYGFEIFIVLYLNEFLFSNTTQNAS